MAIKMEKKDDMKKQGFTLAEVLITLGIIGVVAALTTPALIQNVNNSKVGPTLSKAVATFENACQTMLAQEGTDSISAFIGSSNLSNENSIDLGKELGNYLKITKSTKAPSYTQFSSSVAYSVVDDNSYFKAEDGIAYYILTTTPVPVDTDNYSDIPTNQKIGEVYIDMNDQSKPNKQGRDIFRFYLYNDGTLRAYGSNEFDRSSEKSAAIWGEYTTGEGAAQTTEHGCDSTGVKDADTCAGSIFDNSMKVIYK